MFYYLIYKQMAKFIWRKVNVGFGKETVRWTAVAPAVWMPKTALSFDTKLETIQDESSIWVIVDSVNWYVTKEWSEWSVEANVWIESIAYPLLSTFWSVTSAAASAGAYTHTFTLDNSNEHQSITVWVNDPVSDTAFPLAMVESMTISAEVGGFATLSVEFKAKKGETPGSSYTVSYTNDKYLLAKDGSFKTSSNLAWLDWASAKCIQSFEITFNKNLEDVYCLADVWPADYINKQFSIEWSFTAIYQNESDYKDVALAGTEQAIRFELKDTSTTIWTTDNPTLKIDLAKCNFSEWSKWNWNDELVNQTVSFKWLYSIDDAKAVEVELTNETTSY